MSYVEKIQRRYESVRLEEFDYDNEFGGQWAVTLSFLEPTPRVIVRLIAPTRTYKTFLVDAVNGNVMSIRIRNPSVPARAWP
jgi:hypothetical protein